MKEENQSMTKEEDPNELIVECPVCPATYTRGFWKGRDAELAPGHCLSCGELLFPEVNVHIPGCEPKYIPSQKALFYVDSVTGEVRACATNDDIALARANYALQTCALG